MEQADGAAVSAAHLQEEVVEGIEVRESLEEHERRRRAAFAPNTPVRLRAGRGFFLAVQWNLPLLLLIWYPWTVFHLAMVANCFVWALGCYLAGRVPWCRALLFQPGKEGVPPRWMAAALWMAMLGTITLIAWFLE